MGERMKVFTALLFVISLSNLVYANNMDYKCRLDDKTRSLPRILEFDLPFNSQNYIDLLDSQHFMIVNFYGEHLSMRLERCQPKNKHERFLAIPLRISEVDW